MEQKAAAAAMAGKRAGKKKGKKVVKGNGEPDIVRYGEVNFFAKRPPLPKPIIPPEMMVQKRVDQWDLFDAANFKEKRVAECLAAPVVGPVLRTALIDEALLTPRCQESAEITDLMETASTTRRLRNYDIAIALLIQARHLWSRLVSDKLAEAEPEDKTRSPASACADSPSADAGVASVLPAGHSLIAGGVQD